MDQPVWDAIESLAGHIRQVFRDTGQAQPMDQDWDWHNEIYVGDRYRRAHLEIVDQRHSHGIYILHSTVMPGLTDPGPIWGFDAVCGRNRITGAFLDMSLPARDDHVLAQWWSQTSQAYQWRRPRSLPPWAQEIFSEQMVAAGNLQVGPELDDLVSLARASLEQYMDVIGRIHEPGSQDTNRQRQNFYCLQQRQNPHVVRSMVAMGHTQARVQEFVEQVLWPVI